MSTATVYMSTNDINLLLGLLSEEARQEMRLKGTVPEVIDIEGGVLLSRADMQLMNSYVPQKVREAMLADGTAPRCFNVLTREEAYHDAD